MTDIYHEKETVTLVSKEPLSRETLHKYLKNRNFKSEDDFYYLDRKDRAKPWQAISVLTVDLTMNGEPVYETEKDMEESACSSWDQLNLSYLMASLPEKYMEVICDEIFLLCQHFDLTCNHKGVVFDQYSLFDCFKEYAKELTENYGSPGSEDLAFIIQATYPRNS